MKEFFARLSSRKFLLTIGAIVLVTLFPEHASEILLLVGFFVGAEGVKDVVTAYASGIVGKAQVEKDIALISAGEYVGSDSVSAGNGTRKIVPGGQNR